MPRGGPPTYTYTLPPVYLAVPGTTILATQHNTPLEDIEDTFNTEWPGYLVQWVVPTADVLELPDGAEGAPSLTFTNDTDTGIWRPSSGIVSISTNGVTTASFASTAFTGGTTDSAQYTVSRNGNTGSVLLRGASNSGAGEIELFGSSHATKARDIEFHSNGTTVYSYDFSASAHSFVNPVLISGTAAGSLLTLTSTDAGAAIGPVLDLYRNSSTPAVSDLIGAIDFSGENGAGNKVTYARVQGIITTPTGSSERGGLTISVIENGVLTAYLTAAAVSVAISRPLDISAATAGQIKFPSSQNASSDANTLDDYKEGTTTPTVALATPGTSSMAYTTQTCSFTKIGNLVSFVLTLNFTPTIGTGSGNVNIISGLPNPATITAISVAAINGSWIWPSSRTMVCATIGTTGTIVLEGDGSGLAPTTFGSTNLTNGAGHIIRIAGTYSV